MWTHRLSFLEPFLPTLNQCFPTSSILKGALYLHSHFLPLLEFSSLLLQFPSSCHSQKSRHTLGSSSYTVFPAPTLSFILLKDVRQPKFAFCLSYIKHREGGLRLSKVLVSEGSGYIGIRISPSVLNEDVTLSARALA